MPLTNTQIRKEFEKFIETLPSRVNETPKEVVLDWFLKLHSQELAELREKVENMKFPQPTGKLKESSFAIAGRNLALSLVLDLLPQPEGEHE